MKEQKVIRTTFRLCYDDTERVHFFLESDLVKNNLKLIENLLSENQADFELYVDYEKTIPLSTFKSLEKHIFSGVEVDSTLELVDDKFLKESNSIPYISDKVQKRIKSEKWYLDKVLCEIASWLHTGGIYKIELENL